MSIGVFADKGHQPTTTEVLDTLGSKQQLWKHLNQFIDENYDARGELVYYGKKYGWTIRFRMGSKSLLSLYPGKEGFTVQIVLGLAESERASRLSLGENVTKVLEDSRQLHDGRWLFIEVESEQDLNGVKQLLMTKPRPAK